MGLYSSLEGTNVPSSQSGLPNVSQFGWTSYEMEEYKQLIEYVDEAKRYAQECKDAAEYIGIMKDAIDAIKADIDRLFEQFNLDLTEIREIKVLVQGWHDQVQVWHGEISAYRDEIVAIRDYLNTIKDDVVLLHQQVQNMKDAAAASAKASADSATASEKSAQDSYTYFQRCYDLYVELSKGQVYRGVWNPHSGAYPDHKGTNSVWDVVLNEGEEQFEFDGKLWYWGDRLVHVTDHDEYYQIESGSNVKSVNGKTGAVVINYSDVGALPSTGESSLDGHLTVNFDGEAITIKNKSPDKALHIVGRKSDNTASWIVGQSTDGSSDVVLRSFINSTSLTLQSTKIISNKDLYVNGDRVLTKGYLPTPDEIGSYSKAEIDQQLTNYYTKTESDAQLALKADISFVNAELDKKVDKATTINGKPLTGDITLTSDDTGSVKRTGDKMTGALEGVNGRAFHTSLSTEALKHRAGISNETGYAMLWRYNETEDVKASEFIGINSGSELIFRQDKGLGDGSFIYNKVYHENQLPTPHKLGVVDVEETSTLFKILSKRNENRTKEVQIFSKEGRLFAITADGTKTQFYNDRTYRPSLSDVGGLGVENGNELNIPSTTTDLYINYRTAGPTTIERVVFSNGKSQAGGYNDVVAKEFYAQGDKRVFHQGFLPTAKEIGTYTTNEIDTKITEVNASVDQKVQSAKDLAFIYALIL